MTEKIPAGPDPEIWCAHCYRVLTEEDIAAGCCDHRPAETIGVACEPAEGFVSRDYAGPTGGLVD